MLNEITVYEAKNTKSKANYNVNRIFSFRTSLKARSHKIMEISYTVCVPRIALQFFFLFNLKN